MICCFLAGPAQGGLFRLARFILGTRGAPGPCGKAVVPHRPLPLLIIARRNDRLSHAGAPRANTRATEPTEEGGRAGRNFFARRNERRPALDGVRRIAPAPAKGSATSTRGNPVICCDTAVMASAYWAAHRGPAVFIIALRQSFPRKSALSFERDAAFWRLSDVAKSRESAREQ